MKRNLKKALNTFVNYVIKILNDNIVAIYNYGSVVLNDFKLGWSDIDILVLTKNNIDENTALKLLTIRQDLLKEEPNNKYYKSFEGAVLPVDAFLNKLKTTVVYWGTKGEKIKDSYILDTFSTKELIESGCLLNGNSITNKLKLPTKEDMYVAIQYHYNTIRQVAKTAGRNLYSFGWFLDISRCLYTLKTGNIISKTKAGEWALKNNLCPNKTALKTALKVRKNPIKYKKNNHIMDYAETLGPSIQEYADVLQKFLSGYKIY